MPKLVRTRTWDLGSKGNIWCVQLRDDMDRRAAEDLGLLEAVKLPKPRSDAEDLIGRINDRANTLRANAARAQLRSR